MSILEFDFEWQELPGEAAPEIRGTMANLKISAAGEILTRLFDRRERSVHDSILTPLYPLAEWLVTVWWSLLDECETRTRFIDFRNRHTLSAGERGFPLPDLSLFTDGKRAKLKWKTRRTRFAGVDFLAEGEAEADPEELRQTLRDLVDAVVGRLERQGIAETWLQTEWAVVCAADADEAEFCRTAGRLGLDPYVLDDATAEALLVGARTLPSEVWTECCRAIRPGDLSTVVPGLRTAMDRLRASDSNPLPNAIAELPPGDPASAPWRRGYELARRLRQALSFPNGAVFELEEFVGDPVRTTLYGSENWAGIDALAEAKPGQCPSIWAPPAKQRVETLRFLHARALMNCIPGIGPPFDLLTTAHSAGQQQGRAFAAELLAPAEYLRNRLSAEAVTVDELDDCAAELRVSPQVVRHQVQNHRLAEIVE